MTDNAFSFMTMDIIEKILDRADNPRQLSEFLVAEMRELLGGKIVAILEAKPEDYERPWKLTAVCPERKRAEIDIPPLYRLASTCSSLNAASFCAEDSDQTNASHLLAGAWTNAATLPLGSGELRYGMLILLNIIDPDHIGSMLQTLDPMTKIIGLVLKNSVLYRSLEDTIQHRTSQLAASELRYRTLTETAPVGVFQISEASCFDYVNEAWSEITDIASCDAIGMDWSLTVHPSDRLRVLGLWQASLRDKQQFTAEYRIQRPDVQVRWIYSQAAPLYDNNGKANGYVGVCTDISSRILHEQALKDLNHELERRVKERTMELSQTNKNLEIALDRAQHLQEALIIKEKLASLTPLVAGVSHELNTPIGNITVLSSALQERFNHLKKHHPESLIAPEIQNFMDYLAQTNTLILKSSDFAGKLVQSFKKVVVDREGAQRRRFKLHELVEDCLNLIRPSNKQADWHLHNLVAPEIEIDSYPGALGQVIDNLVRNALIHAFEDRNTGTVAIQAKLVAAEATQNTADAKQLLYLTIQDNGKGIPLQHRHKIFDPFFTTHLGSGGSGLGLSITYNLIQHVLGGTISVESNSQIDGSAPEQCGTCFNIEIPCQRPE